MITEDHVSYEVSKLLKEKGFNEQCRDFYRQENGNWLHKNTYEYNYFNLQMPRWEGCYVCPTLQMVMKWLREVHKLFIEVHIEQGEKVSYKFMIWDFQIIHPNKYVGGTYDFREKQNEFSTPEQACEAAIKYCLENLI